MGKRVVLIVMDSVGVGELPDAADFGDEGSNTVKAAATSGYLDMPNMKKLGFFNIKGIDDMYEDIPEAPMYAVSRLAERSKGKDTTTGHWEISGLISEKPMPTFSNGFPESFIEEFSRRTGRGMLCNKAYSGTDVIRDYGKQHEKTGDLIVYTSADSVFQIAAHEKIVPIEKLYEYCSIARELLQGDLGVGRVIARPFEGEWPYERTPRRHDFSLVPPRDTMLDVLSGNGFDVWSVGKIIDIFAEKGITQYVRTVDNEDGINKTLEYLEREANGLIFTNLVDFDMVYGHRNDAEGYAKALSYFDKRLPEIIEKLNDDDILMITADHGCDPVTPSTDHSREYIPLVVYGKKLKKGVNLGTRESFADIGATILDYFGLEISIDGTSFLKDILK
ncbi:MAG: phosphopentomutase [Lachnospiraceae bacterium]|nr:phosphopentomutase [Lachnospiraceae bacterium]MBR5179489.1 phosphopentomutase [Lachnospiraceae bacterium]